MWLPPMLSIGGRARPGITLRRVCLLRRAPGVSRTVSRIARSPHLVAARCGTSAVVRACVAFCTAQGWSLVGHWSVEVPLG